MSRSAKIAEKYVSALENSDLITRGGKISAVYGILVEAQYCDVHLGELVNIIPAREERPIKAEVVGLRSDKVQLMPLSPSSGLCLSSQVVPLKSKMKIPVGNGLLGRVVDALGTPIDELGEVEVAAQRNVMPDPINPLKRAPINQGLSTGVKAVDLFCPLGRGQRIGIFAGSGVGKSTLLGMMARNTEADIIVIALIGERGREVGDFIRESLGPEGIKRAVVVVASAEQPAVLRRQAAYTATGIAEWFREQGKHVLLIMDSITRFALAQREIGLATGEPIGTRGYPASVFSLLPPLLERAGNLLSAGSITAVYTVLVEGDDLNEPVSDNMRAILDGHIVLSRDLVSRSHYPAIDCLNSLSRLQGALFSKEQSAAVAQLKLLLSTYEDAKDLIDMGAYESGSNTVLDTAIRLLPEIKALLLQDARATVSTDGLWKMVKQLTDRVGGKLIHG